MAYGTSIPIRCFPERPPCCSCHLGGRLASGTPLGPGLLLAELRHGAAGAAFGDIVCFL